MVSVYDFKVKTIEGKEIKLDQYKNRVILIVNTASKCGFTPQYSDLEDLYKKYSGKGFVILGFPCNQFGDQEPGNNKNIASFCQKKYGVDFPMFEKTDVNGKNAHPLYKYLTKTAPGLMGTESIKWNFTKFLIDRKGKIIKRYAPNIGPKEITVDLEKLL